MSLLRRCDMCEEPITATDAYVTVGQWDFHDRPECLGEFQAGAEEARTRSKERVQGKKDPIPKVK